MIFEKIESEGLAHYSYLIGDKNEALVIDARRDCQVYVDLAENQKTEIKHILETHRNEDYVVGSVELRDRTGAKIWHADSELDYHYGNPVAEGTTWEIGRLKMEAISTPGHTPGSISYLLYDYEENPWMVFTGDTLFAGDVGRVDLPGVDRIDEMAAKLYDSLFNKLLTLGDEVIVCPGHGAGSVCGKEIADRPLTTIGFERKHNPKLQIENKEKFVEKVGKELERPPYFRKMEKLNLQGAPILGALPQIRPLTAEQFAGKDDCLSIVDTRMEVSFGTAHLPDSYFIWEDGIPNFAGWFLPYEHPIVLVTEGDPPEKAVRYLIRMGYDEIAGYLRGGLLSWHMAGYESNSIDTITVQELCKKMDNRGDLFILDVRSEEELEEAGEISGAKHIHVTQIIKKIDQIPKDKEIYVFCGSGLRSMIVAGILKRNGVKRLKVILGGLAGWSSTTCPIE